MATRKFMGDTIDITEKSFNRLFVQVIKNYMGEEIVINYRFDADLSADINIDAESIPGGVLITYSTPEESVKEKRLKAKEAKEKKIIEEIKQEKKKVIFQMNAVLDKYKSDSQTKGDIRKVINKIAEDDNLLFISLDSFKENITIMILREIKILKKGNGSLLRKFQTFLKSTYKIQLKPY